jgi:hypothetical protein
MLPPVPGLKDKPMNLESGGRAKSNEPKIKEFEIDLCEYVFSKHRIKARDIKYFILVLAVFNS